MTLQIANGLLAMHVLLCGAGDPEGLLHQADAAEIIAQMGGNTAYTIMVRSHGGDGGPSENPFNNGDPVQGVDTAKLSAWRGHIQQMNAQGIMPLIFFYDDGADPFFGDSEVGAVEAAFIEATVNAFEDLELIWIVAEEYSEALAARAADIAAHIAAADDYNHVIGVHQLNGQVFDFPDERNIGLFAMQFTGTADEIHDAVVANHGQPYATVMAEGHPDAFGSEHRQRAWAVAMGGAGYLQLRWYDPAAPRPLQDRQQEMADCTRLIDFFGRTDWHQMAPADGRALGATKYVLAGDKSLILYKRDAGDLGVSNLSGDFDADWFDPVTGQWVREFNLSFAGDAFLTPPPGFGPEAAVWLSEARGAATAAPPPDPDPDPDPPPPAELAPLAQWAFDGSALNSAPGPDGVVVGTANWVAGQHGQALRFDGATYVEFPDDPALDFRAMQALTLTAWVRPDGGANVFSQWSGNPNRRPLQLELDGSNVRCRLNNKDGDAQSPGSYAPGVWQHYACVWDGASLTLYIDGTAVATDATAPGQLDPNAEASTAGARIKGGAVDNWFLGDLDNLRVYDRALSPAEIAQDMAQ